MLRRALASGDEIIAACQEAGVRLCYAENWVYAPPIQRARRLLPAAGGPILRIVGEESHGGTHAPINKRWETGGGGSLIGKGCHPLSAALYLKADEGRRLPGRARPAPRAATRPARRSLARPPKGAGSAAGPCAHAPSWPRPPSSRRRRVGAR